MDYVLNSKNIYRIDYLKEFRGAKLPRSVLFNVTQISEEEVIELINTDMIEYDDRVVTLTRNQLKHLCDKEVV